jgi:hypothetical protein
MLTDTEKREFALSTIRPMAEFTMPFLTQVVGVIDEQTGEHRGSGIFCMIDGRQAVVTAAHVLRKAWDEGRFISLAFSRGWGDPPGIVEGKIRYFDEFDLAIYLPSKDFPLGEGKSFWPEERIDGNIDRLATDYLFVQGFPGPYSRFTTLMGRAMISESLAYGAMMRYSRSDIPREEMEAFLESSPGYDFLPEGFLKSHQFAFNFSPEPESLIGSGEMSEEERRRRIDDLSNLFVDGDNQTFPGQRQRGSDGISGSPVWRVGALGKPISEWTTRECVLVGIVSDWNQAKKILIATSAAKLFDLAPEF